MYMYIHLYSPHLEEPHEVCGYLNRDIMVSASTLQIILYTKSLISPSQEFVCNRYSHEGSLYIHSPDMCQLLESNSQLLFSRDKRRPMASALTSTQWIYASACHSNCMLPGSGLRLVDRKPCAQCNITTSIQLCQVQPDVSHVNTLSKFKL
jgi:hypothetical protein